MNKIGNNKNEFPIICQGAGWQDGMIGDDWQGQVVTDQFHIDRQVQAGAG